MFHISALHISYNITKKIHFLPFYKNMCQVLTFTFENIDAIPFLTILGTGWQLMLYLTSSSLETNYFGLFFEYCISGHLKY